MRPSKKVWSALALAVLVSAPVGGTVLAADELKIGFVDSGRIFEEYEGAKDAQRSLERDSKEWESKAQDLKSQFTNSAEELESQRLMLSQERLKARETEVATLRKTYEDYVTSIWGEQGELSKRNAEVDKPTTE